WRHSVLERANVILIDLMRLFIAALALGELLLEAARLLIGIVEFGECVGDLHSADVQLEAFDETGIVAALLRQRRNLDRKIGDEGRIDQMFFSDRLEELGEKFSLVHRSNL